MVIVVFRRDLVGGHHDLKAYEEEVRKQLSPFKDVPIVFTSVLEKQRIHKAMELAIGVAQPERFSPPAN